MDSTCNPEIWGKADIESGTYPLVSHLLDTVAASTVVWDQWLRPGLRELLTEALAPNDMSTARAKVSALAGLHDLGKISKIFQSRTLSPDRPSPAMLAANDALKSQGFDFSDRVSVRSGTVSVCDSEVKTLRRHEALTLFITTGAWPSGDELVRDHWVGAVLGGHHGRYHPTEPVDPWTKPVASYQLSSLTQGEWGTQQGAHENAVCSAAGISREQLLEPLQSHQSAATILLTGIVVLSDWLASEDESVYHGRTLSVGLSLGEWVEARAEYFGRRLGETVGVYQDIEDAESAIMGDNVPSSLQREAASAGNGLWIVTVPTGEGKTEAALLRHASVKGEGLLFALPTRATSDAMWDRVQHAFRDTRNAASLLHGYAMLNDFYEPRPSHSCDADVDTGLRAHDWLHGRGRSLLAPVSVGTCDQVLLAALRQKRSFLRLLAVANRHVVLDEVHGYDEYQSTLLKELLAWWGATETRVTLLSASLPTRRHREYANAYSAGSQPEAIYPGATKVTASASSSLLVPSRREYVLNHTLTTATTVDATDAVVGLARGYRLASGSARIAVVCNTVDRAIAAGDALASDGHSVVVIHSRMTAAHRSDTANRLEQLAGKNGGGTGVIVVGTQVIEASLDIDFDHMITELAPAPSLVQRAGRLWRHSKIVDGSWAHSRTARSGNPTLDILITVDPDTGELSVGSSLPYLLAEQKRTLAALTYIYPSEIAVPGDIQGFVDASTPEADATVAEQAALSSHDEGGEFLHHEVRRRAADLAVIPLSTAHSHLSVLSPDMDFATLSTVTTADELSESKTRFTERDSVTCILIDASGVTPWSWTGTPAAAAAIDPSDRKELKKILGATFPVPMHQLDGWTGLSAIDASAWRPQSSLLRGFIPVIVTDSRIYSELTGLNRQVPRTT